MRTRKGLSTRQRDILEFVRQRIREDGIPPTVRDIQAGCAISSTSVVDYNLRLLQRDGYLTRRPDVARGIELPNEDGRNASPLPSVPIMGYIAAGQPLPIFADTTTSPENGLGTITLPPEMVASNLPHYALRVKGMSMVDAFVTEGDTVVVEQRSWADNGDMVVAWLRLEEEATLKRFYHEGDRVRLQPANTQMDPIYSPADNVEVQGRVVGVIRLVR